MSLPTIVGHDEVWKRLERAVEQDRLAHAYLFIGPAGIGKRLMARRLAQGLLCEADRPGIEPCGVCSACQQAEIGAHPDFAEAGKPPDKNEFPIDLVRELSARLALRPARGGYRIVLLDDADTLSEEAANCFLKTLEEPPLGSLLILIGTSAEVQLSTIVSRCQVISFRPLATQDAAGVLLSMGVANDRDEALRLATWAEGSVGAACELTEGNWRDTRQWLLEGLARLPAKSTPFTDQLQDFIEEAGKEAAPRRGRARQLVRMTARAYRDALSIRVRPSVGSDMREETPLCELAQRFDEETLIDLLERTLDAEYHIGRFLHLPLAMDAWIDDLAQISAGAYVPGIVGN